MSKKFNNRQNKSYNTEDGIIWNSRSCAVCAHVWIKKDDKLYCLIGKRGKGVEFSGLYNIPCGYIDWDENLEQACYREIWEEAGLDLAIYEKDMFVKNTLQPILVNSSVDANRQNITMHCFIIIDGEEYEELPKLSLENMEEDECESIEWMELENVIKMNSEDFAFNHLERVKEILDNTINSL